jgi:hypothetical protein
LPIRPSKGRNNLEVVEVHKHMQLQLYRNPFGDHKRTTCDNPETFTSESLFGLIKKLLAGAEAANAVWREICTTK